MSDEYTTEIIDNFNKIAFMQLDIPFENYNKELLSVVIKMKESIAQSIANENTFCNTSIEIIKKISIKYIKEEDDIFTKVIEDFTVYPLALDITEWLRQTIKNITEIKTLNPRAIENMKKQGIIPKKQAGELLLFLIIPSKTEIHIGIYVPPFYQDGFSIEYFIKNALKDIEYNIIYDGNYGFVNYKNDSPLKEKDNVLRKIFEQLKKVKIYIDTMIDEEILYNTFDLD